MKRKIVSTLLRVVRQEEEERRGKNLKEENTDEEATE